MPPGDELRDRLGALAELALGMLPQMFDSGTGRFCHKTVFGEHGHENRGSNVLYTAMTTAGILRQPAAQPDTAFPLGRALDRLHEVAAVGASPELQAIVAWASTLSEDPRGVDVATALAERDDLDRFDSGVLGHAVHGLAVAAESYPQHSERMLEACRRWVAVLLGRYRPAAELFGPRRLPTGARSALIHRLTSFAAQVYPLHGLSAYFRVAGEAPPPILRKVAERIVSAQGPLGQWWWLYSTDSRAVLEGYPVYSVHQDAMAFMALLPVEALGEGSYRGALGKGLDWLSGRNELSTDLTRRDPPFIFRNIQRVGSDADAMFGISRANLARVAARSLRPRADRVHADPTELEVLRECRPYHLGWLLHAYALAAE